MKTIYKNRYEDEYVFTEDKDGNVLWEGSFNFCRFLCPNVYTEAYEKYKSDGGDISLKDFEVEVHRVVLDENGKYKEMSPISKKYGHMVYSDINDISMIDPSGGPYISIDTDLKYIDKIFENKIVKGFQKIETGYKILIK